MTYTEEENERIAIIADGCKCSQKIAEQLYAKQVQSEKSLKMAIASVQRLKLAKMGRNRRVDTKTLAGGL